MSLPKPTVLPKWATDDQLSEVSGQYNVVEPPPEIKLSGWVFDKKPNRQWWNWLHRQTYLWLSYFDENLDFEADSLVPVWTGLTNQPSPNIFYYSKIGDRVSFSCNMIWAGNSDITNPLTMTNLPFPAKSLGGFVQAIHISRTGSPTIQNGTIISGLIDGATTILRIWQEDPATGICQNVTDGKLAVGNLTISGSYLTD